MAADSNSGRSVDVELAAGAAVARGCRNASTSRQSCKPGKPPGIRASQYPRHMERDDSSLQRIRERLAPPPVPKDDRGRTRMVLDTLVLHLHPSRIPKRTLRFSYTWGLGGLAALLVMMLVTTGVFLQINYTPAESLELGGALYSTNCAQCHGPLGQGTPRAPALNVKGFLEETPDGAIQQIITLGVPDTAMPPWGDRMTESEIQAVVGLLRSWEADAPEVAVATTPSGGGGGPPWLRDGSASQTP